MQSISVLGGGSWATALVKILSNNASSVHWWLRNQESVDFICRYHHNPNYLSDVQLDLGKVQPNAVLSEVLSASDLVILAIPAAFLHRSLEHQNTDVFQNKIVFSAIKGIVPEFNLIVGDYMHQQKGVSYDRIGVLTGPCHAEEVALEKLSYLTVASPDTDIVTRMAEVLSCRFIRTVASDDIFGTEYAAVLKNIMAIASGIYHGLGYGDNFQAVLISNAIREIKRFVDAVHPLKRDINDSAYLGDLLVTAYSQFSRNRTFGSMIGKGYTVKSAQMEMNMIAEGFYATKTMKEINDNVQADMPILNAVYDIIYKHAPARRVMKELTSKIN